jgi:hypothetical protein
LIAQTNFFNFVGEKSEFRADFSQQLDISAAICAEREAFAQVNFSRLKSFVDNVAQKNFGVLRGEIFVETNDDCLPMPRNSKRGQSLIERLQQRRRIFGI